MKTHITHPRTLIERAALWARWITDSNRSLEHRANLCNLVRKCGNALMRAWVQTFVELYTEDQQNLNQQRN